LGDKQSFCRSYFSRSTQEIKQIILSLCNAVNDIVFKASEVQGKRFAARGTLAVPSSGGTTGVSENCEIASGYEWAGRGTCQQPPNNAILVETKIVKEFGTKALGLK